MKKPLVIKPEVFSRLAQIPRHERAECMVALCDLADTFGKPRIHSGIGIRKLTKTLFECRANLSLRYLFYDRENDIYVWFLGNHDEIKRILKELS